MAALTGATLVLPQVETVAAVIEDTRAIQLDAPASCPRYCGRIVRGVKADAPTPDWMKRRIERSGIRSISFLVDVTNYMTFDQGRPMHVFDADKVKGTLTVRRAREGFAPT